MHRFVFPPPATTSTDCLATEAKQDERYKKSLTRSTRCRIFGVSGNSAQWNDSKIEDWFLAGHFGPTCGPASCCVCAVGFVRKFQDRYVRIPLEDGFSR
jgi:hypothetical protein